MNFWNTLLMILAVSCVGIPHPIFQKGVSWQKEDCYKLGGGGRILGGIACDISNYPWMVGLILTGSPGRFCGGSLISNSYVLTAAHCLVDHMKKEGRAYSIKVRTGVTKQKTRGMDIDIEKIIPHQKFNKSQKTNDVALIKLANPVKFNENIHPICLPESRDNFSGQQGASAGWGDVEGSKASPVLRKVSLKILDSKTCSKKWNLRMEPTIICGEGEGRKGTCRGDSGGPLFVKDKEHYKVVGIVSYGPKKCGTPEIPSVYTDVKQYLNWIESNTGGISCNR